METLLENELVKGTVHELRTQAELLFFYAYASTYPAAWASLENTKIEHNKLGSGTVLGYVPATSGRNDPKILVRFDLQETPDSNPSPKLLSLPLLFEKGLLKSMTVPSSVVGSFAQFMRSVLEKEMARGTVAPPHSRASVPPTSSSPPRKRDWHLFQEIVRKHHIENLYHFADSRNLASIKRHGGLFSWWQCERRGIKITEPGGDWLSRKLDRRKNLQDYVRLSFNASQPMMHVALRDGRVQGPTILRIDPSVIYLDSTLFSDRNATDREACVGGDIENFEQVKFGIATGQYWTGYQEKKAFQAEVLVKSHVPLDMIKNL